MKKQILSALTAVMTAFSLCGTAVTAAETTTVAGDLNGDGIFTVADVVAMQSWLLGKGSENIDISAADFCKDGKLDVFDMILMKKELIENESPVNPLQPLVQPISCYDIDEAVDRINNYNPEDYPEYLREAYNKMFAEFKNDGIIYTVNCEGIEPAGEAYISLLPDAQYEDRGVGYNFEYKNNFFRVEYHTYAENYNGSVDDMAEYMQFKWKGRVPEKDIEVNGITYSLVDVDGSGCQWDAFANHNPDYYYIVKAYATEEELIEFLTVMRTFGVWLEEPPMVEEPTQYGFYSYEDYEKFLDENELHDKIPTYEDIKEIGEFVHFSINYDYSSGLYFPMSFVLDDGSGDTVLLNISDGKVCVGNRTGENLMSHQVDFSDMRTADTTAEKSFFDIDDRSYNYENGKLVSVEWYTENYKYLLVGTPALCEYPDVEGTYVSGLLDLTNERRNALEKLQSATADDISKVDIMLMPPHETVELSKPQIEEMLTLMKDVKVYEYDNSHLEYGGQSIMFTITYADGGTLTITDFNPFIIINNVGFRTEYEPAQALNVFANSVYSEQK